MQIIAEIGQNHNGDIQLAIDLIHAAKENGADVAKFQLYDAPALFPKENNEWYDYNCKTELSKEDIHTLSEVCDKLNIEFLLSVFDCERVKWAEEIKVKRYKIASRSIRDTDLIKSLKATQKPIIASLGMWDEDDFPEIGYDKLDYLYCVSKYPTPLSDLNFSKIDFNVYAGFSDHTIGITAAQTALARGARILEKHFTLDKNMYGPDHSCSMTPDELKSISNFRSELRECL